MSEAHLFEKCRAYVQSSAEFRAERRDHTHLPSVTLSRQAGARGTTIAKLLTEHLAAEDPAKEPPWTLFDKNLIRRVLDDHNLPRQLEKFINEDQVNELQNTINEIVGLHPSLWELHEKVGDTVVRLLSNGHSIIVGRGACVVGNGLSNVLNIRLVGSFRQRLRHIENVFNLSESQAAARLQNDDRNRRKYFKSHFGRDIDDPELYHMIINTDLMSNEDIVQLISMAALRRTHQHAELVF